MRTLLRGLVGAGTAAVVGLTGIGTAQATQAPAAPVVMAPQTVAQYEAEIAAHVNTARAAAGLNPLAVSVAISDVARGWSVTMANGGRQAGHPSAAFFHNPSYAAQMPAGWRRVAENIAYGGGSSAQYPAASIHQNLMDSPGHRANILRPGLTHLGVGVAFVTIGRASYAFVTQNFAEYPPGVHPDGPSARTPFTQITAHPDFTGDGLGDLFAVDRNGRLFLYPGAGGGALGAARAFGTGWSSMDVYAPGDWNRDGAGDLVAVTARGDLLLYPGNGRGGFGSSSQIGRGWTGYRIVPAGDVNGDGPPDLLAIDTAGRLWLYPGDGRGGFGRRGQVGNGWNGFDLYAAGDMNGDGHADILSIDTAGRLWFYAGRGGGFFHRRTQVGHGWGGFQFASGADFNGDRVNDLMGRDRNGRLWFYAGRPGGTFARAVQIGSGW